MREGEVGTEIAPIIEAASEDACRARGCTAPATCQLARALTGAEQAALKLWVDEDVAQARKYFSLSAKYAAYRDYRVNPSGLGLHGIDIPPGEVRECIPPMRGVARRLGECGKTAAVRHPPTLRRVGRRRITKQDAHSVRELASPCRETLDYMRPAGPGAANLLS
jgi:hypothetical protein